jgi:hypothetical protein
MVRVHLPPSESPQTFRISAEGALLTKAYAAGGRDGLVALIDRQLTDGHFGDWVYLLVDQSFDYVAGNIRSWPASLPGREGWSTLALIDWQPEAAKRPPLRVTYQILSDGRHLLSAATSKISTDLARASRSVSPRPPCCF